MNNATTFLFEDLDIRGRFVRLDSEWQQWTQQRHYTPAASNLLGQCVAFLALVGADVKTLGKLTLQLRGTGKVQTLVVQCQIDEHDLKLRGMIDAPQLEPSDSLIDAFAGGDLAFTLHNAMTQTDYQSIVAILGDDIEQVLSNYLKQSVQQPTRLWLRADGQQVTGLIVEKMPNSDLKDSDGWQRINHLADTLTDEELTQLPIDTILHHLFHEEVISIYHPLPLQHHCPDERERIADVVRSLGKTECEQILADQDGRMVIHNEICDRSYVFTEKDIAQFFNHTLH
jgi:molecular chaperone Hsp33